MHTWVIQFARINILKSYILETLKHQNLEKVAWIFDLKTTLKYASVNIIFVFEMDLAKIV